MSTEKKDALAIPDVAKKLDAQVLQVIGNDALTGFEKAFQIATAAQQLKLLLNAEYMKPIMALQNNRLGFKTDKDPAGYPEDTVKNCLIEAVLTGIQPFGNMFNIISGNMYVTKEGFGYLLANFKGLKYEIIPALPRINADKTSAAVVMKIRWTIGNDSEKERELDIPVKMNQYMGSDAVLGKATRKARAWLFSTISGTEIGDGDVMDVDHKVMPTKGQEISVDDLLVLYELKKEGLNADERKNAERIIFNKEEVSYSKLQKELNSK